MALRIKRGTAALTSASTAGLVARGSTNTTDTSTLSYLFIWRCLPSLLGSAAAAACFFVPQGFSIQPAGHGEKLTDGHCGAGRAFPPSTSRRAYLAARALVRSAPELQRDAGL